MSKVQEFIHSAPCSFLGNGDTERNKTICALDINKVSLDCLLGSESKEGAFKDKVLSKSTQTSLKDLPLVKARIRSYSVSQKSHVIKTLLTDFQCNFLQL